MSKEFKKIFKILDKTKMHIFDGEYIELEQFYLSFSPRIRCRKQIAADGRIVCSMTVKKDAGNGIKAEYEIDISPFYYNGLKEHRISKLIIKKRYAASYEKGISLGIGLFDVYSGDIVAEIFSMEFSNKSEIENFKCPDFLEEIGDIFTVNDIRLGTHKVYIAGKMSDLSRNDYLLDLCIS